MKRSLSYCMIITKTQAPINMSILGELKLYDIFTGHNEIENKTSYFDNTQHNHSDNVAMYEYNDEYYFEDINRCCPHCYSKNIIKNRYNDRKLHILNKGIQKINITVYKCYDCGKYYQTDMSNYVLDNSNITKEVYEIILDLYRYFSASLRKIKRYLKEHHNVDISHQAIENIILNYESENKDKIDVYSGYYLFDALWVSINGIWYYLLAIVDIKHNTIINVELASNESSTTIYNFLRKSTMNQPRISITTDLKKEYRRPIDRLGFKHQYCHFHTQQKINRDITNYISQTNLSEESKNKIYTEKEIITDILNTNSFDKSYKKIYQILNKSERYSEIIVRILKKFILPSLRNLTYYLDNNMIEKTSNKIENIFQKIFSKHDKKIMKSEEGIIQRVYLKIEFWDYDNFLENSR